MLQDKDRIFTNLYNDSSSSLNGAIKRGDWETQKTLFQKIENGL